MYPWRKWYHPTLFWCFINWCSDVACWVWSGRGTVSWNKFQETHIKPIWLRKRPRIIETWCELAAALLYGFELLSHLYIGRYGFVFHVIHRMDIWVIVMTGRIDVVHAIPHYKETKYTKIQYILIKLQERCIMVFRLGPVRYRTVSWLSSSIHVSLRSTVKYEYLRSSIHVSLCSTKIYMTRFARQYMLRFAQHFHDSLRSSYMFRFAHRFPGSSCLLSRVFLR